MIDPSARIYRMIIARWIKLMGLDTLFKNENIKFHTKKDIRPEDQNISFISFIYLSLIFILESYHYIFPMIKISFLYFFIYLSLIFILEFIKIKYASIILKYRKKWKKNNLKTKEFKEMNLRFTYRDLRIDKNYHMKNDININQTRFMIENSLVGKSIWYRFNISYLVPSRFIQELYQSSFLFLLRDYKLIPDLSGWFSEFSGKISIIWSRIPNRRCIASRLSGILTPQDQLRLRWYLGYWTDR